MVAPVYCNNAEITTFQDKDGSKMARFDFFMLEPIPGRYPRLMGPQIVMPRHMAKTAMKKFLGMMARQDEPNAGRAA